MHQLHWPLCGDVLMFIVAAHNNEFNPEIKYNKNHSIKETVDDHLTIVQCWHHLMMEMMRKRIYGKTNDHDADDEQKLA